MGAGFMRNVWWGLTAASLVSITAADAGDRSWYVSVEGGQSDSSIAGAAVMGGGILGLGFPVPFGDPDESITFIGAVGVHISEGLRIEGEVARRSSDLSAGDAAQTSFMLNAAYDIPVLTHLSITLGAGAGADWISVDGFNASEDGVRFAYQGMAGLAYQLNEYVELVGNYRYFETTGSDIGQLTPSGGVIARAIDDRTISLGIRFAL